MRSLTQSLDRFTRMGRTATDTGERTSRSIDRITKSSNSASSSMRSFSTNMTSVRASSSGLSASFSGMQSALVGLAGAYMGVNTAASLFDKTIGAAARFEQQSLALEGMFGDKKAADSYIKMVDKVAGLSPVLNSTEMLSNSKGFIGATKNVEELANVWSLVERAQAFSGKDTQQASFSVKELLADGDYVSFKEAIGGVDKKTLQSIAKMSSFTERAEALGKAFDKLGVNQSMIDKMGNSTLGQWSQLGEGVQTLFRDIGMESNNKLSDFLKRINASFSKLDTAAISDKLGGMLAKATDKAISLYDAFMKWREPITVVAGALATFAGALALVGTISALLNPISLIAMGISAAALGFKALYDNSEKFRGIVDGIKSKVSGLFKAIKADGVKGILDALLPKDSVTKMTEIFSKVKEAIGKVVSWLKTKFNEVKPTLVELGTKFAAFKDTLVNAFTTLYNNAQPILSGIWSALQILGDIAVIVFNNVIVPVISFAMDAFTLAWQVISPVLSALAGAFEWAFGKLKTVWDSTLMPFVSWITEIFGGALSKLGEKMQELSANFEAAGGIWNAVWDTIVISAEKAVNYVIDLINGLISTINNIPFIEIDAVSNVNWSGSATPQGPPPPPPKKSRPGHYHGLANVPYDGYDATLHRNERVLTAQENKAYSSGQGGGGNGAITIAKLADQIIVREDADIEQIALKLAVLLEKERTQRG